MGQLFRKEAGGGSPVLGEVEPPGLFRALPLQGPPSFGCIRLSLALEVRPPSGDCGFIPRRQTRKVQWGLCNPAGRDFRKEAGEGEPCPWEWWTPLTFQSSCRHRAHHHLGALDSL